MSDEPEDDAVEPQPRVLIEPDKVAGVWANFARVSHSPYEFTLDFVRLDFNDQPPSGIVVARVSLSPLLVTQLIEALGSNWKIYAEKAMPPEVRDATQPGPGPEGGGEPGEAPGPPSSGN